MTVPRSAQDVTSDAAPSPLDYDGVSERELQRLLDVPRLALHSDVGSTQDEAHALAASGCPAGTTVLADSQRTGRGRLGRSWESNAGAGVWLTVVERPTDPEAIEVLALRLGLRLAEALDALANGRVTLKWPNDLLVEGQKLGGILAEARWRESRPEWIAIGVGLNVMPPTNAVGATGLQTGVSRVHVARLVVQTVRHAAATSGLLDASELARWHDRDAAHGRTVTAPVRGRVEGISPKGELLVRTGDGALAAVRAGSLRFEEGVC